jgi:hypothetical protein
MGARPIDALPSALTALVDAITRNDARGYFHHCGYARQTTFKPALGRARRGHASQASARMRDIQSLKTTSRVPRTQTGCLAVLFEFNLACSAVATSTMLS